MRLTPSLDCKLGHDPKHRSRRPHADLAGDVDRRPGTFVEAALGRENAFGVGLLPPGWWDDAALARDIDRARPLQGAARTAAYAALQERLLQAAPFAALGSWTGPEYLSPRLGCRVFQGAINALDLGAACPRPTAG